MSLLVAVMQFGEGYDNPGKNDIAAKWIVFFIEYNSPRVRKRRVGTVYKLCLDR